MSPMTNFTMLIRHMVGYMVQLALRQLTFPTQKTPMYGDLIMATLSMGSMLWEVMRIRRASRMDFIIKTALL